MNFEHEKDLIDVMEYYRLQRIDLEREQMPETFYKHTKGWKHQGGAMTKEVKEKLKHNVQLRLKQLREQNKC